MSSSVINSALSDVQAFIDSLKKAGYIAPETTSRIGKAYVYGVLFGTIKLMRLSSANDKTITEAALSTHIPFRPSVLHGICHFGNQLEKYDVPKTSRALDAHHYLRLISGVAPGLVDSLWKFVLNAESEDSSLRARKTEKKTVVLNEALAKMINENYQNNVKKKITSGRSLKVPANLENAGLGKRTTNISDIDIDKLPYFVYNMLSEGAKQAVIECLIGFCVGDQPNPDFGVWKTASDLKVFFEFKNDPVYIRYQDEIILACPDTLHQVVGQAVLKFNIAFFRYFLVGWDDILQYGYQGCQKPISRVYQDYC
jgi:hypothetical protein